MSDWEEARRRALVLGLEATPAQRLAWLEEMIALAHRSGALPRPRPPLTGDDSELT
jgi:hypothetical protein